MNKKMKDALKDYFLKMSVASDEEIDAQIKMLNTQVGKLFQNEMTMEMLGMLHGIKEGRKHNG